MLEFAMSLVRLWVLLIRELRTYQLAGGDGYCSPAATFRL